MYKSRLESGHCIAQRFQRYGTVKEFDTTIMSLKELIEGWKNGSELAEAERYQEAIDAFLDIQDPGSKIHYNAAAVYLRLGNLKKAEKVIYGIMRSVNALT